MVKMKIILVCFSGEGGGGIIMNIFIKNRKGILQISKCFEESKNDILRGHQNNYQKVKLDPT